MRRSTNSVLSLQNRYFCSTNSTPKLGAVFLGFHQLTDRRRQILVNKNALQMNTAGDVFHDGAIGKMDNPSKIVPAPEGLFEKEALENDNIDVVFVGTDLKRRADDVLKCLGAGKHVFCEFPLSLDGSKVEEVLSTAEKQGKLISIGNSRRHDDDLQTARYEFHKLYPTVDHLRILTKEPKEYPEDTPMGKVGQLETTLINCMIPDIDYMLHTFTPIEDVTVSSIEMGPEGVDLNLSILSQKYLHPKTKSYNVKFSLRMLYPGFLNKLFWNDTSIVRADVLSWNTYPWHDCFFTGTVTETERFKDIILGLKAGDASIQPRLDRLHDVNEICKWIPKIIDLAVNVKQFGPLPVPAPAPEIKILKK